MANIRWVGLLLMVATFFFANIGGWTSRYVPLGALVGAAIYFEGLAEKIVNSVTTTRQPGVRPD